MFMVTNRIPVAEGHEAAFEERFKHRSKGIDQQQGFVEFRLLRPKTKFTNEETGELEQLPLPAYYLVQSVWQTEEDFWNWTKSDDFKQAHQNPPPTEMFAGKSVMEVHEMIISNQSTIFDESE